ncbi:MAG TPA: DUF885 domain-containing protein, partial [Sphingomicrobium sp.]
MRNVVRLGVLVAGTAALLVPPAAFAAVPLHQQQTSADAWLKALYDAYSAWDEKESAQIENSRGETESAGYLPRVDAASQLRREAHLKDLLAQLNGISPTQLSPDAQVNAAVFRTMLENQLADYHFRTWEMPFNSDSSFW